MSFELQFVDKVPLITSFVGITRIDLEKKCKNVISDPKNGHHFPRSMSFEVKFTNKVPLTLSKFCLNNQNTFGEKCKIVISDPKNGHHFYIGPTLHVGPNKSDVSISQRSNTLP